MTLATKLHGSEKTFDDLFPDLPGEGVVVVDKTRDVLQPEKVPVTND